MQEAMHVAVVFIETPYGIPVIMDPRKPDPLYWKLPGGKKELSETPTQTAVREIWREIGLRLNPKRLFLVHQELVHQETPDEHMYFIYSAKQRDVRRVRHIGDKGQEIMFMSREDMRKISLLPMHRRILIRKHLI